MKAPSRSSSAGGLGLENPGDAYGTGTATASRCSSRGGAGSSIPQRPGTMSSTMSATEVLSLPAMGRMSLHSTAAREKRSGSPDSPEAPKREDRTPATPYQSPGRVKIQAPGKTEKNQPGKSQSPPRSKLPWGMGKGHRRTKSMEKSHDSMVKAAPGVATASKDDTAAVRPSVYPRWSKT